MVRWTSHVLVWLMIALIYFPLGYLALLSFSSHPETGLPGGFTLDIYRDLFADANAWSALLDERAGGSRRRDHRCRDCFADRASLCRGSQSITPGRA